MSTELTVKLELLLAVRTLVATHLLAHDGVDVKFRTALRTVHLGVVQPCGLGFRLCCYRIHHLSAAVAAKGVLSVKERSIKRERLQPTGYLWFAQVRSIPNETIG